MKVLFYNDTHGTMAEVQTINGPSPEWCHISKAQAGYVRRALCPKKKCDCAKGPSKELNGDSPKNPNFFPSTDGGGWIKIKKEE